MPWHRPGSMRVRPVCIISSSRSLERKERNGISLSMISALAQLGSDPWDEARRPSSLGGTRPSAIDRADPAATGHAPTFFGGPTKSRRSCHHQGAVLMRDNVAVKINIAAAPKMEMAISHKHSVPTFMSICGSLRGNGSNVTTNCRGWAAQSWRTTFSSDE